MTALALDDQNSSLRVQTFAEGLFSRLAHDVELVCRGLSGSADSERGTATLTVPIGRIDVAGTLARGRVDPSGLSPSDRADCLSKMRSDVFRAAPPDAVEVEAELSADRLRVRVRVVPPHGPAAEVSTAIRIVEDSLGKTRASGRCELSLAALGSSVVKGPMNAFRVKDRVAVTFDLVFQPA